MKNLLSVSLAAAMLFFSACAQYKQFTDWAATPSGQAVISAALADALKIVGTLLLAAGPHDSSLRTKAIVQMMAKHPKMSQAEAAIYIDAAIKVKAHGS